MVKKQKKFDNDSSRLNPPLESFFAVDNSQRSTINSKEPLLMSKDKAELCNKILKARKLAVSRGIDPKKAEERIRASHP